MFPSNKPLFAAPTIFRSKWSCLVLIPYTLRLNSDILTITDNFELKNHLNESSLNSTSIHYKLIGLFKVSFKWPLHLDNWPTQSQRYLGKYYYRYFLLLPIIIIFHRTVNFEKSKTI